MMMIRNVNSNKSVRTLLRNYHTTTMLNNKLIQPRSFIEDEQNNNTDIDLNQDRPRVSEGEFEPSRHHLKHAQKHEKDKKSKFMYPLRLDKRDQPVYAFDRFKAFNKARYPAIEAQKLLIPKKPQHPYNPAAQTEPQRVEFRYGVQSEDLIAADASPVVQQIFSWENASQSEINSRAKQLAVKRFQMHPSDHGSAAVQVAVMTERIRALSIHMQNHKQDNYTARRLTILVNRRKKMMKYLRKQNPEVYWKVMRGLEIRAKF
jgi:small subunit ribosomal protein S15